MRPRPLRRSPAVAACACNALTETSASVANRTGSVRHLNFLIAAKPPGARLGERPTLDGDEPEANPSVFHCVQGGPPGEGRSCLGFAAPIPASFTSDTLLGVTLPQRETFRVQPAFGGVAIFR